MMGIEEQLRGLAGASQRPSWDQIEERAAELRKRRHRVRGGVAVAAAAAIAGVLAMLHGGPSGTSVEGPAASAVPAQESPTTTLTSEDIASRTCESDPASAPSANPSPEIGELYEEIDSSGLAEIPFPPDCAARAFVDANAFTVTAGQPHGDLPVYDAEGNQIGVLVYGLPAMTVEEYEQDPEGHRQAGIARVEELESLSTDSGSDD